MGKQIPYIGFSLFFELFGKKKNDNDRDNEINAVGEIMDVLCATYIHTCIHTSTSSYGKRAKPSRAQGPVLTGHLVTLQNVCVCVPRSFSTPRKEKKTRIPPPPSSFLSFSSPKTKGPK